jgi:hypothetical protein
MVLGVLFMIGLKVIYVTDISILACGRVNSNILWDDATHNN